MGIRGIIEKKKDGDELSGDEVGYFVSGYLRGEIPDYQMSALLMAICFQGMSFRETLDLTKAMVSSGERLDLSHIPGPKVDKHSTGGVGDKVSLVLAPLVASCGVVVPMVSGRSLGHTGGTLDKLESIPGFRTELSTPEFMSSLEKRGVAIVAQTGEMVPADRKLYGLRDATGTVASIPLISASIVSKKVAEGAESLVLDVKVGKGAFMKSIEEARELANLMMEMGREMGIRVVALLTSAEQPLGRTIGNSLEVEETISTLRGEEATSDLLEVTLELGSHMLVLGKIAKKLSQARGLLWDALQSGRGLSKLRELVEGQGGDSSVLDDPGRLPTSKVKLEVASPESGFLSRIDALEIGLAANSLGAGRESLGVAVDSSVGIVLDKKVGDEVEVGERVAVIHTNDQERGEGARLRVERALKVGPNKVTPPEFIIETLEAGR